MTIKNVKVETYSLPTFYACYLMYEDDSGLNESEIKKIDQFVKRNNLSFLMNVSETSEFSHMNDLDNIGNDVSDFTFKVKE
jgi:hypothetical protein